MLQLTDINVINSLLKKHGFSFSKAMGQNFIVDNTVCPGIVMDAQIDENDNVLEIGPGIGVLTSELASVSKKVVAIELDNRLLPILNETLADFDNVKIINDDVLKIDLKKLFCDEFNNEPVKVCANLPYYITSPIIMMLLSSGLNITQITVMVQKEAADRLTAKVGTKQSGAITVSANYYAEITKLFDVKNTSFFPSPKVDSSVITFKMRKAPLIDVDEKFFFSLVKAAFSMRRKTAANAISGSLSIEKSDVLSALDNIGLSQTIRPENLTMKDFEALCKMLGTKNDN